MSKNLCPENNITFETSYQIRFEIPIPAGTYTCSAVIESTDTDSAACLMLFTYADGSSKEVYLTRKPGERVFKTTELTQDSTRVRIYASEGHSLSSGDTATYSKLQIEAGDQMTEYVPYGEESSEELTEKYLHVMIGGAVEEMPNPDACELNYWMNKALEVMKG